MVPLYSAHYATDAQVVPCALVEVATLNSCGMRLVAASPSRVMSKIERSPGSRSCAHCSENGHCLLSLALAQGVTGRWDAERHIR